MVNFKSVPFIGRNFKHWEACLDSTSCKANDLAPKSMRPLQRFQPLVVSSGLSSCSGDKSRSMSSTPTSNLSPNAVIMEEDVTGGQHSTFIPRQRLLLAYVTKNTARVYSYNCSRDIVERLSKQVTQLGHWFSARSALSMSVVTQKLGLFHHLPFYRKAKKASSRRNSNVFMGNFSRFGKNRFSTAFLHFRQR